MFFHPQKHIKDVNLTFLFDGLLVFLNLRVVSYEKKMHFRLRVKSELLVLLMSRQQNNAFTMHSNVLFMLRKDVATMPLCSGGIRIFAALRHAFRVPQARAFADLRPASRVAQSRVLFCLNNLLLIHLFINQFNSL